ncbi:MAG: hypothetical protein WC378_01310 [Opitutaceae bacterium]
MNTPTFTWNVGTWNGSQATPARIYGPGNEVGSSPTFCPNADGQCTFQWAGRIIGYTGPVTVYYRKNGGSAVAILATTFDGPNSVAADTQKIYGLSATDMLEFYVSPCTGVGNIPNAVTAWTSIEVMAYNWA